MTKTKRFVLTVMFAGLSGFGGLSGSGGAAFAQTGAVPAAAADPASPPAPPPAAPAGDAADPRKACTTAMNADPAFAAAIVKVADEKAAKQRDDALLAAHQTAVAQVQKNEKHVIYAYAGMWIIAALFLLYLWRRQGALKAEILTLRRDLEAAADAPAAKGRP